MVDCVTHHSSALANKGELLPVTVDFGMNPQNAVEINRLAQGILGDRREW